MEYCRWIESIIWQLPLLAFGSTTATYNWGVNYMHSTNCSSNYVCVRYSSSPVYSSLSGIYLKGCALHVPIPSRIKICATSNMNRPVIPGMWLNYKRAWEIEWEEFGLQWDPKDLHRFDVIFHMAHLIHFSTSRQKERVAICCLLAPKCFHRTVFPLRHYLPGSLRSLSFTQTDLFNSDTVRLNPVSLQMY